MSFPDSVTAEAMAACGRCCCICHRFRGTKMELHHIKQKADGGEDTFDNCIPLCFDCHSEMGKADPKHPKGKRYSELELRRHRDNWYKKVKTSPTYPTDKVIYKDDIALFQSICQYFDDNMRYWLKDADLAESHPYEAFDSLGVILRMQDNAFYEFLNYDLEKWRIDLFGAIQAFLKYKSSHTFATVVGQEEKCVTRLWKLHNTNWIPRKMSYDECLTKYEQEAEMLNDLAGAVGTAYYPFAQQGRRLFAE